LRGLPAIAKKGKLIISFIIIKSSFVNNYPILLPLCMHSIFSKLFNSIENIYYDSRWENYVEFTRESIMLLEEYNSDREDENKYSGIYISKGEILENGDFIYDKPIRNNSYYQDGMNRYDMY
jgi:hypothetical protein